MPSLNNPELVPESADKKNLENLLPLERYGRLTIQGRQMVDSADQPVALRGMSMFHCPDGFKFRNYDCMKWLRDDWNCDILRLAILPELYRKERAAQNHMITEFIDNCIKLGIYVILDFHGGDAPMKELDNAKVMFDTFSRKYAELPNIIYEPFNEPCAKEGDPSIRWSEDVKPYHEEIVKVIRSNDSSNIIILGTPDYSLNVDDIIDDPVTIDSNIMYVAHFYAASHMYEYRQRVYKTLQAGFPVFISEFGSCEYTGNGRFDEQGLAQWMKLLDQYQISWCNWSVHDKNETASIVICGTDPKGSWKDSDLTSSGKIIRQYLRREINTEHVCIENY